MRNGWEWDGVGIVDGMAIQGHHGGRSSEGDGDGEGEGMQDGGRYGGRDII